LAVFGDAGVARTSNDARPSFLGGDRDWVRSVGGALCVRTRYIRVSGVLSSVTQP
jgi:hypothetical protein